MATQQGNKLSALLHEHIVLATAVVGRLTKDSAGDHRVV